MSRNLSARVTSLCALVVPMGYFAVSVNATAGPATGSLFARIILRDRTKLASPTPAQILSGGNLNSLFFNVGAIPYSNIIPSGSSPPLAKVLHQPTASNTDNYGNTIDVDDELALDLAFMCTTSATAWAGTLSMYYPVSWLLV